MTSPSSSTLGRSASARGARPPGARPGDAHLGTEYRPSYGAAAVAALVVFVIYLVTLAPSTAMWDTSEYMAAAYVLGLPHPPGNPMFVLLGRVFSLLPIAPTVAQRINVLAAFASAVSAGFWFLVVERVLVSWLPQRWVRWIGAGAATLVGATAFTVWNQSVVNEKVYTVSLAGLAIVSWLIVRWCDDPVGRTADRLLVLVAYLVGLGYAVHPAGFLVGPPVLVAVLVRRPQTLLRWKLLLACLAGLVLGLSSFAYEPIRAAHFPEINEGEPTACVTKISVSCTFDHVTWERLKSNINREQYAKPPVTERQAPFSAQVQMYWMYFRWQWLRDVYNTKPGLQSALAVLYFGLGLFGGWVHWKRDRRSFWYFGPLVFTLTPALIFYLNFKYGWSQSPELGGGVPREVRDRDYFYLWSFSTWGVWVGLGITQLWVSLAEMFGKDGSVRATRSDEDATSGSRPRAREVLGQMSGAMAHPTRRGLLLASPVLLLAFVPLLGNHRFAPRSGEKFTRAWAVDLLNSVEPYGILVTNGDNDTFPLWYAQEVEGIRKDVIVAVTSYLNIDWYGRQLIRRPVYEYDSLKGPAIYRGHVWPKPSGPPLKMDYTQVDAIPPYVQLSEPQRFVYKGIDVTIPPRVLSRDQLMVLRFVQDASDTRPLYFSSGDYAQDLGLAPYVLTQGLAQKLITSGKIVPTPDTVAINGGFLDIPRSKALWTQVFEGPKALIAQRDWVDRASVGIPYFYVVTGDRLAAALAQRGDTATAMKIQKEVEAMAAKAQLTGGQ